MRQIVQEVTRFVNDGQPGAMLSSAAERFGLRDVRLHCIRLLSWWGRQLLMQTHYPYLWFREPESWQASFREFAASIPELHDLLCFKETGCHFSGAVTRSEMQEINDYVRQNFRRTLHKRQSTPGTVGLAQSNKLTQR